MVCRQCRGMGPGHCTTQGEADIQALDTACLVNFHHVAGTSACGMCAAVQHSMFWQGNLRYSLMCFLQHCLCTLCLCCVQVVYDDGQVDWLYMGLERVRLLITAGEELTPPDAATLQQLAQR